MNLEQNEFAMRLLRTACAELRSATACALLLLRESKDPKATAVSEEEYLAILDRSFAVALLRAGVRVLVDERECHLHPALAEFDGVFEQYIAEIFHPSEGMGTSLELLERRFALMYRQKIAKLPPVFTKQEISAQLRYLAWRGASGLIRPDLTVIRCLESRHGLSQLLLMVIVLPYLLLMAADEIEGVQNCVLQETDDIDEIRDAISAYAPIPRVMWYPYLQRVSDSPEREQLESARQTELRRQLLEFVFDKLHPGSKYLVGLWYSQELSRSA